MGDTCSDGAWGGADNDRSKSPLHTPTYFLFFFPLLGGAPPPPPPKPVVEGGRAGFFFLTGGVSASTSSTSAACAQGEARFVKISGVGKREAAWEARQQRRSQGDEASRDHRSSWAKRRTLLRAMNSSSALICFEYFLSVET